jgi:hypothetical protein
VLLVPSYPSHFSSPCTNAYNVSTPTANTVVQQIQKMEKEGALTPSSTVALIYRTNAQSRALEEACVAGNLRHVLRGKAGSFYSRAEIRDCICFLKWLYNGRDEGAMRRAIKTPTRGIGDVSVGGFLRYCNVVERNRLEKTEGADADAALTYLDILVSRCPRPETNLRIDGAMSSNSAVLLGGTRKMDRVCRRDKKWISMGLHLVRCCRCCFALFGADAILFIFVLRMIVSSCVRSVFGIRKSTVGDEYVQKR